MTDAEYEYISLDDKIRERESWLKIVILGSFCLLAFALFSVFIWKIIDGTITIDLTNFDFSDLMSLLLALFAISISILLYLKATETSNIFYDNTYKFTQEVSEILGRIEAGFGERLRHIDEGYGTLQKELVAQLNQEETQNEISEDKETLDKVQDEKVNILENLLDKAQVDKAEKDKILTNLNKKDNEIYSLKEKLHNLEKQIVVNEELPHYSNNKDNEFLEYVNLFIRRYPLITNSKMPTLRISYKFEEFLKRNITKESYNNFVQEGYIYKDYSITRKGFNLFVDYIEFSRSKE
jgi:hypothetical protein